jgi:dienelactone hydrolase
VDAISTLAVPAAAARPRELARAELGIAWTAIGLIALHVADDSFFQPEPGTSAADHLVSGLVPLAVLLGLAWVYPRVRAGARASIALSLGIFGIAVGASEAVYYTIKVGASRDDYTGFLALAAGVALLGLGVVTLWRSRRTDDRLARRYGRRTLVAFAGLIVFVVLVVPVAVSYVFTHATRAVVPPARLGAVHEDVSFRTSDDLKLNGWYVPSKNGAAVVVYPGRAGPQRQARMLARHGYGVLLFDRRGEATSDGDPNAFGWEFDKDLRAAAAFLRRRSDVTRDQIGGIGLSVGGEALLQTGARSNAYDAIVSEGAGVRSLREQRMLPGLGMKIFQLPMAVITAATATFANEPPPPNLRDLSSRIKRPVMFIYAGHGQGGENLTARFYAAAQEPKILWKIPDAEHTGGIEARPAEYERRVVGFFDRNLLGR